MSKTEERFWGLVFFFTTLGCLAWFLTTLQLAGLPYVGSEPYPRWIWYNPIHHLAGLVFFAMAGVACAIVARKGILKT